MLTRAELLPRASTGVGGLDDILGGGLARNRLHLLEGSPGTGKTTIALQFLLAGAQLGEAGIYVSLAETERELREGAKSHGWILDKEIEIFELVPPESVLDPDQHQSLLYSSDLELGETIQRIFEAIQRVNPKRVVIDSLSEIRLLGQSSLRYRRQILALKHYFAQNHSTVIMLDDLTTESTDRAVHSIAHGVIHLDQVAPLYGGDRRRLRVVKCRGQSFRGGYHDFSIEAGGVEVFPRLVAAEHRKGFDGKLVSSGIAGLDELLGDGIAAGSSTLILGPAGTGKSLLGLHYAAAAIARGERAALFAFDEELGLLFSRAKGFGIDLEAMRDAGKLFIEQMDAAELSPGEFSQRVRRCIDRENIKTVIIDSLNGYQASMPEEQFLILHLHELLQYLNRQGASTFLTIAQHGMIGDMRQTIDVTYLADTVIVLRYFEALGRVRRAISVIKKRTGSHHPRVSHRQRRHHHGRAAAGVSGRIARGAHLRRQGRAADGKRRVNGPMPDPERTLLLAPRGRDAVVAKGILREAGIRADICVDLAELVQEIRRGADVAVVTEEATRSFDMRELAAWVAAQPPWSDFPFILLTEHGGGLERNPAAAQLTNILGNVTFLERPFHPTTLVSVVQTGLRGRRRQYECRNLAAEQENARGGAHVRTRRRQSPAARSDRGARARGVDVAPDAAPGGRRPAHRRRGP
jgi:circadian clock protein KaiC